MLVTDSSLSAFTSATSAPKKAATAMPARMTLSRLNAPSPRPSHSAPPRAANAPTSAAGATSPAWLNPASPGKPPSRTTSGPPRAMAMLAPQAAPAEMPRVKGSASGLRNTPCKAAPAMASAPPHRAARHTRASRMLTTTPARAASSGAGASPTRAPSVRNTLAALKFTGPGKQASGSETSHNTTRPAKTGHSLRQCGKEGEDAVVVMLALWPYPAGKRGPKLWPARRPDRAHRRPCRASIKKSLFHLWWKRPVFPLSCRQKPVAVGRRVPHRDAVIP